MEQPVLLPHTVFDPSPLEFELTDFYESRNLLINESGVGGNPYKSKVGRSLSHKDGPDVLNGKNLKLRAKRDKKG